MTVSLTSTKLLIPPPQRVLVPRLRLIEQLNQGLEKKLTLVSAPAGYGKTMLLSAWANECRVPVAWISLDDGENDPTRFLAYLVAALDKFRPGISEYFIYSVDLDRIFVRNTKVRQVIDDMILMEAV